MLNKVIYFDFLDVEGDCVLQWLYNAPEKSWEELQAAKKAAADIILLSPLQVQSYVSDLYVANHYP